MTRLVILPLVLSHDRKKSEYPMKFQITAFSTLVSWVWSMHQSYLISTISKTVGGKCTIVVNMVQFWLPLHLLLVNEPAWLHRNQVRGIPTWQPQCRYSIPNSAFGGGSSINVQWLQYLSFIRSLQPWQCPTQYGQLRYCCFSWATKIVFLMRMWAGVLLAPSLASSMSVRWRCSYRCSTLKSDESPPEPPGAGNCGRWGEWTTFITIENILKSLMPR